MFWYSRRKSGVFCLHSQIMIKKTPIRQPNPQDNKERVYWGEAKKFFQSGLDLTSVQKHSYAEFIKSGISGALASVFPIDDFTGKNWELTLVDPALLKPRLTVKQALEKGLSFDASLSATCELLNKRLGKRVKAKVYLGEIPMMTKEGTFVINGIERCIINQLVRSPGVYFTGDADPASGRMLYRAEIRPARGSWLEFEVSRNNVITVRIDRRRKFAATTFLRVLGYGSDVQIKELFAKVDINSEYRYIEETLEKDPTKGSAEAVLEFYRKIRPGEPVVLESAEEMIKGMFFNNRRYNLSRTGRHKINKRLGLGLDEREENWVLKPEDVVATLKYLIRLQNGEEKEDDIDHLANRRVRLVGELVGDGPFRLGLLRLERSIKERMTLLDLESAASPVQLVNARPLMAAVNEFFRTDQLSSILDQTNPLSELDNLRRLTVLGKGGISRERVSFSIRDLSASQYGRICPVKSPEGPNIGLVTYMALLARVDEYGFLETPYRKVSSGLEGGKKQGKPKVTDEILYLTADDEEKHTITHAGVEIGEDRVIKDKRVSVRSGGEFFDAPIENVNLIDVDSRQVVGVAANLIPFLAHDDVGRALMGSNMQCQAVPLIKPRAPIVGTGMERLVGEAMGLAVKSDFNGIVKYVDGEKIEIEIDSGQEELAEKVREEFGGRVEKRIEGLKTVAYGLEKFKRTSQSTCYSQRSLVSVGERVERGQIIIDGPAMENGELALGANLTVAYMSYYGLGYEDAIIVSERLVRDDSLTSISIEEYEAELVETKLGPEEITRDIPNVGDDDLLNLDEEGIVMVGTEVTANSILVGKVAPKGETELTAEERLLRAIFGEKAKEVRDTSLRVPHGEGGVVIGIQVLDRDKGDELPAGTLKLIKIKVAQIRKLAVGDKLAGRHGNKGVVSKVVPMADMPYLEDGTPVDIIISPLSVLARMNLGQLLEAHLGWALSKRGLKAGLPVFGETEETRVAEELKKAGLPVDGKVKLYDGKTGRIYDQKITVGQAYILKLTHMIEDKTHARATGPYSLVTQQPLGGKAQMGGQRFGEMEVWALEAHRAAYSLQEMLTIKSDDVVGRSRAFEAIVKGLEISEPSVPESFRVLVRELNSLGLSVNPIKPIFRSKTKGLRDGSNQKGSSLQGDDGLPVLDGDEESLSESSGDGLDARGEDRQKIEEILKTEEKE